MHKFSRCDWSGSREPPLLPIKCDQVAHVFPRLVRSLSLVYCHWLLVVIHGLLVLSIYQLWRDRNLDVIACELDVINSVLGAICKAKHFVGLFFAASLLEPQSLWQFACRLWVCKYFFRLTFFRQVKPPQFSKTLKMSRSPAKLWRGLHQVLPSLSIWVLRNTVFIQKVSLSFVVFHGLVLLYSRPHWSLQFARRVSHINLEMA